MQFLLDFWAWNSNNKILKYFIFSILAGKFKYENFSILAGKFKYDNFSNLAGKFKYYNFSTVFFNDFCPLCLGLRFTEDRPRIRQRWTRHAKFNFFTRSAHQTTKEEGLKATPVWHVSRNFWPQRLKVFFKVRFPLGRIRKLFPMKLS